MERNEFNYPEYCASVAYLYLKLKAEAEHAPEEAVKCGYWTSILEFFRSGPPAETENEKLQRASWFKAAQKVLGSNAPTPGSTDALAARNERPFTRLEKPRTELAGLANRLERNPALLSDLLHALERGDETYFLYLTLEVKKISLWLGPFKRKSRSSADAAPMPRPDAVPDAEKRVQEAPPWEDEWTWFWDDGLAAQSEQQEHPSEHPAREKMLALSLEFPRQYEFCEKIRSWKEAEKTKRAQETATTAGGKLLEQLVNEVFVQPENAEILRNLAERLYNSPKDQSKLALLLGKTPSRWLREEEAESLWDRRAYHGEPGCPKPDQRRMTGPPADVTGLCFSGGGIRSATFNLGILQALAELHLLPKFDYLSTVSGGGYIHQWVAAWWKREAESAGWNPGRDCPGTGTPFETVRKALVSQPISTLPGIEATQISFLRRFSNYLTPQVGLLTADTWTAVAIWTRNTLLNQIIIMSGLLTILSLLRAWLLGMDRLSDQEGKLGWLVESSMVDMLLFACPFFYIFLRVSRFAEQVDTRLTGKQPCRGDSRISIASFALLLFALLYTTICAGSGFKFEAANGTLGDWLLCLLKAPGAWFLVIALVAWPASIGLAGFTEARYVKSHGAKTVFRRKMTIAMTGVLAGALVAFLLAVTFRVLFRSLPTFWSSSIGNSQNSVLATIVEYVKVHSAIGRELLFVFVPPLLVSALFLVSVLHVGLNKQVFRDEVLEWMARLRALVFLVGFAWLAAAGCVVLAGPLVATAGGLGAGKWWSLATAAWGAISTGGAFAAKSKPSADDSFLKQYGRPVLLAVAPYVFMAGLLVGMAALVNVVTDGNGVTLWIHWGLLFSMSLAAVVLYGWQVDINEMSMHSFYRNRLARCYQGASVIDRQPDAFTGFSGEDRSIRLAELRYRQPEGVQGTYPGPFPIFCCTMNFSSGEDLAWQERKGASFAYTPLFSGYDIPWTGIDREQDRELYYSGFRDTTDLGHPHGPGLADACAISGAAVSPAWGYHTTVGLAFLMTCFNVRLGVWKRNTRYPARSRDARQQASLELLPQSPAFGLWYLIGELFGKTDAKSEYLYLTDGGHFDNMGLYELVRRECRYIVICDAEEDGGLTFEGLAMAIRKCRTDFGVDIRLDVKGIIKKKDAEYSGVQCVVGTILYPNDDSRTPEPDQGKIVYLKSTLTSREPADLLSYKLKHEEFPHDTTADQWFSESQFESYRALGRYIGLTSLKRGFADQSKSPEQFRGTRAEFFDRLYQVWGPKAENDTKNEQKAEAAGLKEVPAEANGRRHAGLACVTANAVESRLIDNGNTVHPSG